ncbi:NAD-dependent deacylase [Ramlibacter ginsenosidimutans]|uniref:NAD-dependent protein deacylase n=1 Tax=Ramlibacter ginsenosidimutans TaxID=502333 RepID=A0A934WNP2_9BURK|nr:NAD-dependent deacylase [Ramlibacter ginsenosidimutans]
MNQAVSEWVRDARRIVLLSGAGMSAESGVPTFRDAQTGLWARFRPEELATEDAFRANPQRVWDWYASRREMIAQVTPNAGHVAVAEFQRRHPGRLTVVTQNVDGLHQRAGSPGVLALHGNIAEDRWLDRARSCCVPENIEAGRPPRCAICGNLRRPAVVWFGEMLPAQVLRQAEEAAAACDLMLVVGTSGVVYPAAGLARATAGRVVVVNPHASELDDAAHAVLRGTAAALLPQLLLGAP